MKMELIEGSETSAIKLRRRGITQKKTLHMEHGESLKSRIYRSVNRLFGAPCGAVG